ncbi:MAG: 3'(2'),5'-bisphosphate nucleotidase CysQ [Deltaproteobacteria bacterium]|nr:3'(2'),5'-bisphosphate nucleotidase CysQ [Deltaproteobacteria bacterium]
MSDPADLELATSLARAAAQAILDVKAEARAHTQTKSDQSPVTLADLSADRLLRAGLAGTGDLVVTEETWAEALMPRAGRVWIVDPLDGTEDFVAGRPDYVVQVGLVVDGVPRLGVICQPETGIVWRGVVGGGGFCERIAGDVVVRRSLPPGGTLDHPPRIAVSVSHPSALVDYVVGELGGVVVPMGSVGLKIGLLVDGGADAYVTGSKRIKVWDTCAPAAILLAAGGFVSTLSQQELRYDGAVVHEDGMCGWGAAARASLLPRLQEALARFAS